MATQSKKNKDTKISLTAILVEDNKSKGFTSFFAQFPNIIAEGDNEDDAISNLFKLVNTVFKYQKNKEVKHSLLVGTKANNVKTHSYEFVASV